MAKLDKITIHKPLDNKTVDVNMKHVEPTRTYYSNSKQTSILQQTNSYAYKEVDGKDIRFYVMSSRDGHFYNPWKDDGRKIHKWNRVQEKVFNNYVIFLNSNKEAYLTQAEKENIYG